MARKVRDLIVYQIRAAANVVRSPSKTVHRLGIGKRWIDGVFANSLYRLAGKRVVHTVHDILPHDRSTYLDRLACTLVYRSVASELICHTQHVRRRLVEEFGVQPHRITVAPHGTYRPANDPGITRGLARQRLGLPEGAFILLCFGWQRPYKGTHFLLEALAQEWPKGLRVVIKGNAHSSYARQIQRTIDEQRLHDKVRADFGHVHDDEMELLFKASNAVALPYFEGSQSGVLFMSYAFGRPVLASDVGGFPTHVEPGKTGEIFAKGDAGNLRAKLNLMMLDGQASYDEEAIRGYAYANHSWEACAAAVNGIFDRRSNGAKGPATERRLPGRRGLGDRSRVGHRAPRRNATGPGGLAPFSPDRVAHARQLHTLRAAKVVIALVCWIADRIASAVGYLIGVPARGSFTILYYHSVPDDKRECFARQMDSLVRLAEPVHADCRIPPSSGQRRVAVTFDDGMSSVIRNAIPELEKRGIPATVFVVAGDVGGNAGWLPPESSDSGSREILASTVELRKLRQDLVTVGSHTMTHPDLTALTAQETEIELTASRRMLETMLGREVRLLSFPHGAFSRRLIKQARAAGYHHLFSSEPVPAQRTPNEYVSGRIRTDPTDWPIEFWLKIQGAYRWLPGAFGLKRLVGRLLRGRTRMRSGRLRGKSARRVGDGGAVCGPGKHRQAAPRAKSTTDRAREADAYVVLTAARDEERHVATTIESIASQTVPPLRWTVVNDGSRDGTGDIIRRHVGSLPYLDVVDRGGNGSDRRFSSKVEALRVAYERVRALEFGYVAIVDADMRLSPDHFERMLDAFRRDESLGVAGGWILERESGGERARRGNRTRSVAGACQIFRRACFDQIGGIPMLRNGHEDTMACVAARMNGWKVRSFPERGCLHLKPTGGANGGRLRSAVDLGKSDYYAGYHPLFLLAKAMRRINERPFVVRSVMRCWGYFSCAALSRHRDVDNAIVRFMQQEQLRLLLGRREEVAAVAADKGQGQDPCSN
jgi:peptidoglycan/xylan/chitin deacetylase (PgdA/CDA1 family)/glycosyltransferase involved in cell wall biosynthesis